MKTQQLKTKLQETKSYENEMKYGSIILLSMSILLFIYLFFFTKDTNKLDEIIGTSLYIGIAGVIFLYIFLNTRSYRKELEKFILQLEKNDKLNY